MSTIKIKVMPKAKRNMVVEEQERLKIYVTAPAVDGKANKAVIKILAEYLGVKKSNLCIIRGDKSREKIVQVSD